MEETSVAARVVASEPDHALITNEVPATIVPTLNNPKAAAPVAPTDSLVRIMIEFAVTAVVEMVAVPPTRVTLPKEFAPAAVVLATLVDEILFPAVPKTRFPFVAVIFPRVAVNDVDEVKEPVTDVFPVAFPMFVAPVPPVPIVVTPEPELLIEVVPVIAVGPGVTVREVNVSAPPATLVQMPLPE